MAVSRYLFLFLVTFCLSAKADKVNELKELVVDGRKHQVLHLTGYVREYSMLATFTDTIFLFREKAVDFMFPSTGERRFPGWTRPRVLASRSCYRFSGATVRDSVSDRCDRHFSWSDWVGMVPYARVPGVLRPEGISTDTLYGKFGAVTIWNRDNDRIAVRADVLSDSINRRWVPGFTSFLRSDADFTDFYVEYLFDGVTQDEILPENIRNMTYEIRADGFSRDIHRIERRTSPLFMETVAELYVTGRERLSIKEARKSQKRPPLDIDIAQIVPDDAPPLEPEIVDLISRVHNIEADSLRLQAEPDYKLYYERPKWPLKHQILSRLRQMIGIYRLPKVRLHPSSSRK